MPDEAAGERIAGTGRIEHGFQRIRGRKEHAVTREHERAMLALLDDHVARPAFENPARGLHEICLLGELPRFAVIERDEIDAPEQLDEFGTAALDPEVHRVARDQLRLLHLVEHLQLQARIDVREKHERRTPELLGNLRAEVREHAEMRFECLGGVEVVPISAAPAEAAAFSAFESGEIDAALPRAAPVSPPDSRLPTTPTSCTGAKCDALDAKNVPDPPSTSSARPNGVSTESSATEPTTSTALAASCTGCTSGARVCCEDVVTCAPER